MPLQQIRRHLAGDPAAVVISATPTADGRVVVVVGVDVARTVTVTMTAWAFHALGPDGAAEVVTSSYRRIVRLLERRPT